MNTGSSQARVVREYETDTGPCFHDMQAAVGDWLGDTVDRQDGSYLRQLQLPAGQTAQVSATAFGQGLPEEKVQGAGAARRRRARISLHAGAAVPVGALNDVASLGGGANLDFGYRFNPRFTVMGVVGLHVIQGLRVVTHYSINLRAHPPGRRFFPYVQGGPGFYRNAIVPFGRTRQGGGFNVGGGLVFAASPKFHLEGGVDYHYFSGGRGNIGFLQIHAGFSFRFGS